MEIKENLSAKRTDLHTLCMDNEAWNQARALAEDEGRSISSFLRTTVKNLYKKKKKQQELSS